MAGQEGWAQDDGTMSTITATDNRVPVVSVCCGRSGKRRKFKLKKALRKTVFWKRRNKYFDAQVGNVEAWAGDELEQQESFGFFYFDAQEDVISDYDYNLHLGDLSLRSKKKGAPSTIPEEQLDEASILTPKQKTTSIPIEELTPENATIEQLLQELQNPSFKSPKTGQSGYPGGFTPEQLEQVEIFLRGLEEAKKTNPGIYEQVYSYLDVEDMPMTISRCIRATKFNAQEMLDRLIANQEQFDHAKSKQFYPNVDEAIGAPFSVFLSQYPFVGLGRSNQSLPVNYFQAGKINPEGIMALTTVDQLEGYYWWSFMYKFKRELREARLHAPDKTPSYGLCEAVTIIDLQGLSASALSSDTMDVIKLSSKIADFYPETLHKMLIVNAPGFFAMSWGIIKKFIDPQTAARIQIFSNKNKALKALQEMVDIDEIPSDYGGNNKTIKEALMNWSTDPLLLRQEVELLYIKRRGKAHGKQSWELKEGERVDITVYTRSASGAKITVKKDDNEVQSVEAFCAMEGDTIKSNNCKIDMGDLVGPCTLSLEADDLDTVDKKHHKESRGYFLVVGDVKKVV
ncbi:Phosphatidylinositol/phosphatidylcholine transfer protein [Seminavis robusta]|uniref:Phosphatidylinositol/phosphatidylcholine transfer protein n=1 Tax=Seminavis robusta TaxID=568900 RepID=A0A9N8EIW3_9STRA|nr:Phosphatidylinositol/phosphatidylcholine transfer protein [Seminavis robusta]|eukprot:Sro1272_g258250.1 Phosphatidylinositol/phosphatidylcholine transfer protein (571) ;mRNA; f:23867-25796